MNGSFIKERDWSLEWCESVMSSRKSHFALNAPMGAGKSWGMASVATALLNLPENSNHKVIFVFPKNGIAHGMTSKELNFEHGAFKIKKVNDLCTQNWENKYSRLVDFIKSEIPDGALPEERFLAVTHATFSKLSKQHRKHLKNCFIFIDEAHHVAGHIEDGEDYTNRLGEVLNYCFSHDESNSLSLLFVTATFFRTNRLDIIAKEYQERVDWFRVSYDVYFDTICKRIKGFGFDFVVDNEDWDVLLDKALNKVEFEPTIIFSPPENHRVSFDNKHINIRGILNAIADPLTSETILDESIGLYEVEHKGVKRKLLNLVDPATNKDGLHWLLSSEENQSSVDFVINTKMMNEGTDWPKANRVIVIGQRGSLGELKQMAGRAFRDHESKEVGCNAHVIQIIPNIDPTDENKTTLNEMMNVFIRAMMLVEVYRPRPIRRHRREAVDTQWMDELSEQLNGNEEEIVRIVSQLKDVWMNVQIENSDLSKTEIHNLCQLQSIMFLESQDIGNAANIVAGMMTAMYRHSANRERLGGNISRTYELNTIEDLPEGDVLELVESLDGGIADVFAYRMGLGDVQRGYEHFKDARRFASYEEVKAAVIDAGFETKRQYQDGYKDLPVNAPSSLADVFIDKWVSWDDFFNRDCSGIATYEEVKNAAIDAGFESRRQYQDGYKDLPVKAPGCLQRQFSDKWISWDDFFNRDCSEFASYEEVKEAAISAGFESSGNYQDGYKDLPVKAPSCLQIQFSDKWISWYDFLDKEKLASYEEVKKEVIAVGVTTGDEYRAVYKDLPVKAPAQPQKIYKEWNGWDSFLGKEKLASYEEVKEAVKKSGIKTQKEYFDNYKDLPVNAARNPGRSYTDSWVSWYDFLGKENKNFASYEEVRKAVIKAGIVFTTEYHQSYKELPVKAPRKPERVYANSWVSWKEFLGQAA